ncbi:MAG: excinuclease ABC subunit UvrA [Deltaproteobacteria bacterium]
MKKAIKISGARTHNLKGVSCRFPARRISVVTGVSGSGKSSLVFDTLYAEGQRRYVQSLSTYARLFLEQMERPDVDSISDIPPAIALEQKNSIKNARSTVGTITEVHDYLRLLMTHAGRMTCPDCGKDVANDSPESATSALLDWPVGTRAVFSARIPVGGMESAEVADALQAQGYTRLVIDRQVVELEEAAAQALSGAEVEVVVDRISIGPDRQSRIGEALERAFQLGAGEAGVFSIAGDRQATFSRRHLCRGCRREFVKPTPHLFSFNSPLGACPECEGFGRIVDIDLDKVIPNKSLSLRDGAVAPWSTPAYQEFQNDFLAAAERLGYSTELPYSQLSEAAQKWVLEGDRENSGVEGFFKWLESRRYKTHVRILLARYRSYRVCPDCRGNRLKPEALAVRIGRRNLADFCSLSIADLQKTIGRLKLDQQLRQRTESVMRELKNRLAYLIEVGLGYLTLERQARTLSGGEAQRIHLASALGSSLTDTLYALDEPTVGLHPRDSARLLKVLRRLTRMGNTVVVVEHDPTIIQGAHHVIDLGPGGGSRGGEILYEGKPGSLPGQDSATGRLLLIRTLHRQEKSNSNGNHGKLVIKGASENNLRIEHLEIPLGGLVCITGVSGSGKSTLVERIIYQNYLKQNGLGGQEAGACQSIDGFEHIDEVLMMNQAPVGRSLRSNPATYLKFYDDIRKLFASTPAARRAKITASRFSFNTVGGRCEKCQGTGTVTIEMHFMANVDVVCEECAGRRFKKNVLEIRYRDRNITDVLDLTVEDAREFFHDRTSLRAKLDCLTSVGLEYLAIGQATSTLSGGEAQRLKLAAFLADESKSSSSLFIFDEPTTGLHLQDVHTLITVLDGLAKRGHSVIVIEHHTDFISHANHVIDLGPEGGDGGGRVVVTGTPLEVSQCSSSYTGHELRNLLGVDNARTDED